MNKRIVLSFLSILTTLSLVSGATFAYFNDTEDSSGNVIAAGTLGFASPVDNFYDISDIAPGDSVTGAPEGDGDVATGYDYNIGNGGSIDADHVEITVANTPSDAANPMDVKLTITSLKYKPRGGSAIDIKSILESNQASNSIAAGDDGADADTDGDYLIRSEGGQTFANFLDSGTLTLDSWENAPSALEIVDNTADGGAPEGLAAGTNADFDLDLEFDSDAGNEYQGDSVTTVVTFTLNQDASQ